MKRIKLRNGGRRKALFGTDGAITAAATLAAAAMTTKATIDGAKEQAKATIDNAKTQAESIKAQTANNTTLQKQQIDFSRQQKQEDRQQQQDINMTLQMLANRENADARYEQMQPQLKYGGNKTNTSYGGGSMPFVVTDGGGVMPIATDLEGYGLYELYGNDHEHYHKTAKGKHKSGVGIKFDDGSVVEGEGNQNTNQGELLYVTPDDAMFISKHSIDGFNPAKAVKQGVHPVQAFNIQEAIKTIKGYNDDGSKTKRRSIKKAFGGITDPINPVMDNNLNIGNVAVGGAYAANRQATSPVKGIVAKNGTRIRLGLGSSLKNFWGNHAGATYNAAGNLLGAGITAIGNNYASKKLSRAYTEAGNILADAYSQMKGIDLSEVKREDYEAPHTLAVIRGANTNINPQLERLRRNASSERKEINRGTLSSAARQQRLAGVNDRMFQRMGEQYTYKQNADEAIRQGNAERITQTAQANADRDVQARKDWGNQRLSLLQYNNNIENAKIAGMAQAKADALTQSSMAKAQGLQSTMSAIGTGLASSAQGFASSYDAVRKENNDFFSTYQGLGDASQVTAAITRAERTGDTSYVKALLQKYSVGTTDTEKAHYAQLVQWAKNKGIKIPTASTTIAPSTSTSDVYDSMYFG
ncbi:MAG: hypothetical protein [crAssphage sp. isolate ctcc615]|uniref:Uncharacterized protein n=1 Tax=crAssphage sp. isolate ctcc615 TaxID=2989853 RepID=A0A345BNZ3_9CAUD|nr:MAG: hypothetical protein KNU00_gp77 [crAssphage sp. isolate ctcc615]AXF52164.1 MAG: hypothetical protein [crAssphage sp. isolate ctcc615]